MSQRRQVTVAARREVKAGHVPCGRCLVVCANEPLLRAHLTYEHLMLPALAEVEAHEQATGIRRDVDGQCIGCQAPLGRAHYDKCSQVRRAARDGYPAEVA